MTNSAAQSRATRIGPVGRVLLVTGLAVGVMPVLGANPAYACSCVQTDEQDQYDQATHVFKGTLTEGAVERSGDQDSGAGSVTYTFDVLDSYKGTVGDPQKVSTASQSATCGVNLDGTGPFLVFAYDAGDPTGRAASVGDDPPAPASPDASDTPAAETPAAEAPVLTMSLCGGTRPIGLNDQPTFGAAPDDGAPAEPTPAEPVTPTGEPAKPAEPSTEAPAEPAEEKSAVANAIAKVSSLLKRLIEPLRPTAP